MTNWSAIEMEDHLRSEDRLRSKQTKDVGRINIDLVKNNKKRTIQCIRCHRRVSTFVKIEWMLFCKHCLKEFVSWV